MANIISEIKGFKGAGMDLDSAISEISREDLITAYNLVVDGNIEGEDGIGTDLASTREILGYDMPAGLNKCMGADKFETERIILFFIYNSFGYHQFGEYNYDIDVKTLLFTNITDSDGEDVLPLTTSNYVMDIKLVDGRIVLFTDSNIEVGYINKERLKDGSYGVLTEDDWKLIKAQPLVPPTLTYNNDSGRSVNLLKNKLFRAREQYGYLDEEPSAWSSISKREVPELESTTSIGEDVTKNNNLIITVPIGSDRVEDINVAVSYAQYDWFTAKSVKRSYVLTLPSAIDVESDIYEAYDSANGTYSFAFYNDGSYVNIDPRDTDLEYDRVPLKAESLELIEAQILLLAGITEDYERPVITVNLSAADYDPKLEIGSADADPFRVTNMYDVDPPGMEGKRRIYVQFKGVAKTGDDILVVVRDFRDVTITKSYEYEVLSPQNNDTLGALQLFAVKMGNAGGSGGVGAVAYAEGDHYVLTWLDFPYYGYGYAFVTNSSVGTGQLASIHALKRNSAYQAAILPFDRYGRPYPMITGDNFIFKTNSAAQSKGLTPRLSWQILSNFPVGVASFQWLLTQNTTHEKILSINGKYLRTDGDYMVLSINPLKIFNLRNSSSILAYEYTEGDRATFEYYADNDGSNKVYFDNPFIDVQVVGFEIVVDTAPDPDTTTYELKVRLNSSIDTAVISGKNIYFELYTPRLRVVTSGETTTYLDTLFFEIGEQINVVNGVPEITSGVITDGDVYFQTRDYVSAVDETTYSTYLAEDFNFSPLYVSDYNSYGRGWQYNERDGVKKRKAGIRYSDKFVIDSKLNKLNRFFAERLYGDNDGETSSTNGWIRKIRQRANYLVCIQEVKEGHIPLNQSILEDQSAQSQAFISDKLLNKIRYTETGTFGMGNARESYNESDNGAIGFIDPNNSNPMRDGANGLTEIAGKMSKFFLGTLQQAKQLGKAIIGYWDNYTKKRIWSIQDDDDDLTQIPINSGSLVYLDEYIIDASDITITEQPTNATVTLISGEWVITPNTGETGSGSFEFSFPTPDGTVVKNGCFVIQAGDVTPIAFAFVDLTGQNVSTVVYSNTILIDGINVPTPISITGGEYSINGGAYTSANGTVVQNDTVVVRQTTSASVTTTTSAVLTVGTYSDSFDATTNSGALVGNDLREGTLQRNNCASGSSGTYWPYSIPADTYFDTTKAAANAQADAAAQTEANTNGSCILDSQVSVLVIDVQVDTACNLCVYIDTPGVAESGNIVAVAQNFYETSDPPENAYLLASDNISGVTTRRFQWYIGKLDSMYSIGSVPQFILKLRGRTNIAGTIGGVYALKYPTQRMIMTGSPGTYIPTITPAGGPPTILWSGSIMAGADGTVGTGVGAVIRTFTYDRVSNTIIVTA